MKLRRLLKKETKKKRLKKTIRISLKSMDLRKNSKILTTMTLTTTKKRMIIMKQTKIKTRCLSTLKMKERKTFTKTEKIWIL